MLDLDDLAVQEHENWVWHGAEALRPEYRRALVSLSRGGADAAIVREFDLEKKAFIKDGYTLPEAKSRVAWRNADSVFVGTDFGPGSLTDSGYPRIVKEWKRGTPLAEAAVVFEGRTEDMGVERPPRPDARLRARHHHAHADVLHLGDLPPPRREARQDRQARRRPGLLPPRVAAPPAPHRLDRWRHGLKNHTHTQSQNYPSVNCRKKCIVYDLGISIDIGQQPGEKRGQHDTPKSTKEKFPAKIITRQLQPMEY